MPLDRKRLAEIQELVERMAREPDNLDVVGDLANEAPEILAHVRDLAGLLACACSAIDTRVASPEDLAHRIEAALGGADEVKRLAEGYRARDRFGWSEGDFESGGVKIE